MLDDGEIIGIITNHLRFSSQITGLKDSLDYYLGNPLGNEIEGRSQVVSQDVGDVVEWIMPQIVKNLTAQGEVVVFDPVGPDDEDQAELESFYVQDVLMKKNTGFLTIHAAVKDSLIQRNGIVAVEFDDRTKYRIKTAQAQNELELMVLEATGKEIVDLQDDGIVIFKEAYTEPKVCVRPVAPEDFIYNADHNSIDLQDARFQCEIVTQTASKWIEDGYDAEVIEDVMGNYAYIATHRSYRFSAQNETLVLPVNPSTDDSQRIITCGICYVKIDLYDCGIATLYRAVVVLTGTGSALSASHLLEIEAVESSPYFGTTAILMSHKFQGLSMYDRLKILQDQMTALMRSNLDNIYFTNNQRNAVIENMVNMDDLQTSVPGGIVRVRQQGAIEPIVTPPIGQNAFSMMEHLTNVRTGRTGVSPEGAAQPHDVGDRVGSQGIANIMAAKEELTGLMVRVMAETLMKPVCIRIRDLCVQHATGQAENFKMRGTWQQVNPKDWFKRESTTIRCGTGAGDKTFKITALSTILQYQQTAVSVPGQSLVSPGNIYKTLDELSKAYGLVGASRYFTDPQSPEGQQFAQQVAQQQQAAQQAQMQQQQTELKAMADVAQAEVSKAQTAQQNVALKAQIDQQAQQIKVLEQQLKAKQGTDELQFKYDQLESTTALKLLELEKTAEEFEATEDKLEEDDG